MNYFKQKYHNWIVKKLTKENGGGLSPENVNVEKKTIDFGFYSLNKMFFEPKHDLLVAMLVKWYGYQVVEQRFEFRMINPPQSSSPFIEHIQPPQ